MMQQCRAKEISSQLKFADISRRRKFAATNQTSNVEVARERDSRVREGTTSGKTRD